MCSPAKQLVLKKENKKLKSRIEDSEDEVKRLSETVDFFKKACCTLLEKHKDIDKVGEDWYFDGKKLGNTLDDAVFALVDMVVEE